MFTKDSPMKILSVLTLLTGGAVLLAACGGGGSHPQATVSSTTTASSTAGAFRGGPPGASGQIAEIDGNTMQVQNPASGQVAVDVTASTRYTQAVATTLSAVTVGSCIVATTPASASGTTTPTAPPSSPPSGPRTITAGTVVVAAPSSTGSCGGVFGNRPGAGTRTGARPSGLPSGAATGAGRFARAFGDVIAGEVTAISGSAISVQAAQRSPDSASTTTENDTVDVTAATKYTHTVAATKAALKVGLCVNATGTAAADGSITASNVAITSPGSTGCDVIGRFGGGTANAGGPGGQ